ncbi:hypothetical protein [Streptomyces sp. t39]|uniref:hypothetical protein n=1 Tax=Streptomyces sp. t39 TaxID=1828156 RepID=UPI0021C75BB8|nr:hypothetical protein [Streptomyces sp. t39]
MRYLAESFLLGALWRGRSVEQLLGPCGSAGHLGVRYVEVRAAKTSFEVWLHTVEDVGSENFCDLGEFPPFDPDDEAGEFGRLLGMAEDPLAAVVVAEQCTGAGRGRWVNEGVVQDEYGDFVRAGRPSDASPGGWPWPDGPAVERPRA